MPLPLWLNLQKKSIQSESPHLNTFVESSYHAFRTWHLPRHSVSWLPASRDLITISRHSCVTSVNPRTHMGAFFVCVFFLNQLINNNNKLPSRDTLVSPSVTPKHIWRHFWLIFVFFLNRLINTNSKLPSRDTPVSPSVTPQTQIWSRQVPRLTSEQWFREPD